MNKYKIGFIISSLIIALSGCITKEEPKKAEEKKVDIYSFTNQYEKRTNREFVLNELQKETMNKVIESFNLFLTEKAYKNFPTINTFVKKNDWKIDIQERKGEYYHYTAIMGDGSNVEILFSHFNFGQDTHEIHVYNLNESQCNYLLNHYKYDRNITATVEQYYYGPDKISSSDASCQDFRNSEKRDVSVALEHNGKLKGKDYLHFKGEIDDLVNQNYEKLVSNYEKKLYFTEKPVSYKTFYDGVDYVINPKNNHITVGALTKETCKTIIYNLPNNVKYNFVDGKQCSNGLNTLELYKA